jgi:hypothetical protein
VALQDLAGHGRVARLSGLQALSRDRQGNLLRHWLRAGHDTAPAPPSWTNCSTRWRTARREATMALIVHKYGGTSMGSTERIRNVAKRVAKWARAGHQMVVVPSAMSGETNRLLGLAKELRPPRPTTPTCANWTCWPPPASRSRWACWPSRCRPRA